MKYSVILHKLYTSLSHMHGAHDSKNELTSLVQLLGGFATQAGKVGHFDVEAAFAANALMQRDILAVKLDANGIAVRQTALPVTRKAGRVGWGGSKIVASTLDEVCVILLGQEIH